METKKKYIAPELTVDYIQVELGYAGTRLRVDLDLLEDDPSTHSESWLMDEQIGNTETSWF